MYSCRSSPCLQIRWDNNLHFTLAIKMMCVLMIQSIVVVVVVMVVVVISVIVN